MSTFFAIRESFESPAGNTSHNSAKGLLTYKMKDVYIAGIRIDNLTFNEATSRIEDLIKQQKPSYVVTPNVDHINQLHDDPEFFEIYRNADLVLVDSMILLWSAKYLNTPFKEKISGSDLFPALCETASSKGYKIFLLGGRPGAAEKAIEEIKKKHPLITIAGSYCPPYGFEKDEEENQGIIEMIQKARPDILFVGLGAPKQEKWIYRNMNACSVPVSIGVGVTFEFIARMVKRAPVWMQKNGLEWLWRLIQEPTRLWKRYFKDLAFFFLILKQKREQKNSKY